MKEQADRCRNLAKNTDHFTQRRLLDLAAKYENRLARSPRTLDIPGHLLQAGLPDGHT